MDINWKDAIDKARKETFRWKGIKTSVFGRVNIVKTCILSKFNHIAAIIPQPNKDLIKQIENIIVDFINNSKRHVYPKELMFTPKEQGGLGLPIISDFWMALATSWLKRIPTSKSYWLTLLGEKVKINPNLLCTLSTYCLTHETVAKGTNCFWEAVLERWYDNFKRMCKSNPSLQLAETIDRNLYVTGSSFSIAKKRVFVPLQTLIDQNYNLLPLNSILEKYPEIKMIDYTYNAIKGATSTLLKNLRNWVTPRNRDKKMTFLKETITMCPTLPAVPNIFHQIKMSQKGCKAIRRTLAPEVSLKNHWKCIRKIETKTGATVEPDEEKYIIKNLVKADRLMFAKELKLQIIRNVYLNNSLLYNIGKIESNLCTHCSKKDDNVHHFFECKQVREVWNIISEILNMNGNFVYIDVKTAIMGFTDLPTNDFRNLLVDFTRYEIKNSQIIRQNPDKK